MSKQFWIIDTDTPGENRGSHTAFGPFPTQRAAEAHLRADLKSLWMSSCNCMKRGEPWSGPQIILQEVRTVQPEVDYTVKIRLFEA